MPKAYCPFCDEPIQSTTKKCRDCGESIDPTLRRVEEARDASRQGQSVSRNVGGGGATSSDLLHRLRRHPEDAQAWQQFDAFYRSLLLSWLRRYSIQPQDADDLIQQVLEVVVREMDHYDPKKGSFYGWLRGILVNRLRQFRRSQRVRPRAAGGDFNEEVLNQLADHRNDPDRAWDREHARHVVRRLLDRIEPYFSPTTWQAFQRVMGGEKPAVVAANLNISLNAVYHAKSAVLMTLRQEMEDHPL